MPRVPSLLLFFATAWFPFFGVAQEPFPLVKSVDRQPLLAQVQRVKKAMSFLGVPLDERTVSELDGLKKLDSDDEVARRVQSILDQRCLFGVELLKSGSSRISQGPAPPILQEQGWQTFLVKVANRSGVSGRMRVTSPHAKPLPHSPADQVAFRWMELASYEGRPLNPNLSGLELEYRILQVYCRDAGKKSALFEFAVGKQDDQGEILKRWTFEEGAAGWIAMNQSELEVRQGSLFVTSTGGDPFIGTRVKAKAGPMVLRFWGNYETDGIGQVFWWTREKPQADGNRSVNFLAKPGKEKLYEIEFQPQGELKGLRIDPLIRPGKVRLDWIELCSLERFNHWSKIAIDFQCLPATTVRFRVLDAYGKPGFARFEIRNQRGEIFPAQSKRLAPDFFFQKQIYRGDNETISLPQGTYRITCSRGPETVPEVKTIVVGPRPAEFFYRVKRWIDPSLDGWWSGDHHIHAAGCMHYDNPTQGVMPQDMIRHIRGEDLKVGCCLTWGPCFDFQKRFFTGKTAEQSSYPYTLRYDVEVSGFGSHVSGHLNLLNLQQQIYPGGESKDHWPTLGLNTLRWAKKQGAVCGPAHSSMGLTRFIGRVSGTEGMDGPFRLPNYNIPAYDGIGANEFVMNVTHQVPGPDGKPVPAVDFISAMNTERVAEWNMWYHVLNCGFRVAVSGETDFPCISGERVGIGRVYAEVNGKLTFGKWVQSIGTGRSYVSDGNCHLIGFGAQANGGQKQARCGVAGSQLEIAGNQSVAFFTRVAARSDQKKPVKVELIVNGYPVASQQVPADGKSRKITFDHSFRSSSWAAIRVFPQAHTNPIFLQVDEQPLRASKASAEWCLAGVDQCWKSKKSTYADAEQQDAREAYQHAREVYSRIILDCQELRPDRPADENPRPSPKDGNR